MAEKKTPPPPYEGEQLNACLARSFDFNVTQAVTVSGDTWNPCGHMLLQVGRVNWLYFHVAGVVQAGGSTAGLYWNCPAKERFK